MADSIGNAALFLSGNTAGLSSSLDQAKSQISGFFASTGGGGGGVGIVGGPMVGMIGAVVGAVKKAISIIEEGVKSAFERIATTAREAGKFGIDVQSFGGLQFAAERSHVSVEELSHAMGHLSKEIGEGSKESKGALDRLGLSAADLRNQPLDQAFETVAQKMSEVQNPADRAKIALDLFGRAGADLLPLLNKGAAGIQAAKEQAKDLGLALDAADTAKVVAAKKEIGLTGKILEGMWNKIAVAIAPVVEFIVRQINKLLTFINHLVDGLKAVSEFFFGKGEAPEAPVKQLDVAQAALNATIKLTENHLQEQIDTFGMSAEAIEIYKLKVAGATDAQLEHAKSLADVITFKKDYNKLLEEGKKLTEQFRSPQQKFDDELGKVSNLLEKGIIDFSVYKNAIGKAREELTKSFETKEIKMPEAKIQGSEAAARRVLEHRLGISDQGEQIKKILMAQADIAQNQLREQQETNKTLKENKVGVV